MDINQIIRKLKADGTGESLRPVWDAGLECVYLPALECYLDPDSLAIGPLAWDEATQEAQKRGGRLASREEMTVVALQKDAVDDLLKRHSPRTLSGLDGPLWSSTIHAPGLAWCVSLRSGEMTWAPLSDGKEAIVVRNFNKK